MEPDSIIQLADALSSAESAHDFHAALRRALESYDRLNQARVEQSAIKLVCRAGCSLCCWLRVDATAPEVFLIAETLRAELPPQVRAALPPQELQALRERLASHAEKVSHMTVLEHATRNVACPLSRDGWCSVYEVRPHTCRRHHSQDLAACQYTYDHPDDLKFPGAHHRELFDDLTDAMGMHAATRSHLSGHSSLSIFLTKGSASAPSSMNM